LAAWGIGFGLATVLFALLSLDRSKGSSETSGVTELAHQVGKDESIPNPESGAIEATSITLRGKDRQGVQLTCDSITFFGEDNSKRNAVATEKLFSSLRIWDIEGGFPRLHLQVEPGNGFSFVELKGQGDRGRIRAFVGRRGNSGISIDDPDNGELFLAPGP
jgi:hypothetical protein